MAEWGRAGSGSRIAEQQHDRRCQIGRPTYLGAVDRAPERDCRRLGRS